LPEAHVEAPTVGSVILAGVLLKLGAYGLFRFVIPLFADATYFFLPLLYTLCLLGIIYTCCSTVRQVDLKKIIAYASVSHMSFVILGLFTSTIQGVAGSIFLMLSHGIVSSGLFFLIGCLYDRYKTRVLRYYTGLVHTMPVFSFLFFFLILSNISFPGTSSFIGEFLVLVGLFENNFFAAFVATFSIILTAVYSI
jgi:NADH:ubiquinone oxidoreductase subunit 4 (subunit M)